MARKPKEVPEPMPEHFGTHAIGQAPDGSMNPPYIPDGDPLDGYPDIEDDEEE